MENSEIEVNQTPIDEEIVIEDSNNGNINNDGDDSFLSGGEMEDELGSDVINAVAKFKDGTSKSVKKSRRKFAMNIATDEVFNLSSDQLLQQNQPPLSPNSSSRPPLYNNNNNGNSLSPNSILSKTSQPVQGKQTTSSASTSTVTSPYKPSPLSFSSGILPNSRIDESPPTLGKYQLLHHIGQSYIGNTFSAVPPDSSEYVSIKVIDRERLNIIHQNILINEFQLLKTLKHSGIVQYIGIINDNTGLGLVQEFYENGSLSDIFNRSGSIQESLVAKYTLQVLEALGYIHSQGIVHRNLKSNNVLLAKGGKVKISDFAIGIRSSGVGVDPSVRFSIIGHPYWASPEVLQMKSFNHKVDTWSVGCLIMELIVGHPPFSHLEPMEALIEIINPKSSIFPNCLDENEQSLFSPELSQFLELCFKKDPSERASVHDLLRHSWLSSSGSSGENSINPNVVHQSHNSNNRSEFFTLDFLSQSEQNEKEVSKLLSDELILNQIDVRKFEFLHYNDSGPTIILDDNDNQINNNNDDNSNNNSSSNSNNNNSSNNEFNKLSKDEQIEKLKSIIDHNSTIANNLKYTIQEVLQEQLKYFEICTLMKSKTLELLNQNKTGARISAHSNMLLKRTNQMATDLGRKNETLQSNIKRLEDYLITKDDCAKKLANMVYRNKISFDSLLNPTLAANLSYQIGSKTWKKGQEKRAFATLKDNFLFFFKNEKSSYPIDVIYINDKRNLTISSTQDSKKKIYLICIGTTIHDQIIDQQPPLTPSTNINSSSSNSGSGSSNNNNNNNNNSNNSDNLLSTSPGSLVNSTSNPSIANNSNGNNSSNNSSSNNSNQLTPNSKESSKEKESSSKEKKEKDKDKESSKDKDKEKDKDKDKESSKDKEDKDSLKLDLGSNNYSPDTIWCLLAFDNSKNMENWYGLLESVVPWYEKKSYEISKPIITEKKHQKQKSLDSSSKSDGKNDWKKESGGIKFQGVLGIKLDDLMARESSTAELPYFLSKMLKFLEKNVDEEGILRMSGSSVEISEMRDKIQKGESIDYTSKDPHAVTGLLKTFLRELPESILPEYLRIQSTEILGNNRFTQQDKVREIQGLLAQLSKPHYNLLKHMLFFAKQVVDRSEYNKMVIANVTTCFSPTLRLPPGLFHFLINTYDQSFPKFNLST